MKFTSDSDFTGDQTMDSDNTSSILASPEPVTVIHFRLYISGGAPNSMRAIKNLKAIGDEYLPGQYQIEIIDSLQSPTRALTDNILLTPALVKVSPAPVWRIYGDLSATAKILLLLELVEHHT